MSDDLSWMDTHHLKVRRDLISRLVIPLDGIGEAASQQRAIAAVQMSAMMYEIEAWQQAMKKAERDIAALRAERDEARRLVCELATEYKAEMFCPKGTIIPKSDRALANAYGWDCFKEKP